MGKGVKIVLALAIALIFPTMIALLIFLALPSSKNTKTPDRPDYASAEKYCNGNYSLSYRYDTNCKNTLETINNKIESDYQAQRKEIDKLNNSVAINRITAALIAAILGFIIIIFLTSFTPLAIGISGGSTIILMVTTAFLTQFSSSINGLITGLYLVCFAVLLFLLFRIDSMFPEPKIDLKDSPAKPNQPSDIQPSTTPDTNNATPSADNIKDLKK